TLPPCEQVVAADFDRARHVLWRQRAEREIAAKRRGLVRAVNVALQRQPAGARDVPIDPEARLRDVPFVERISEARRLRSVALGVLHVASHSKVLAEPAGVAQAAVDLLLVAGSEL